MHPGSINQGQTFRSDCTAVFVNEIHYNNAGTDYFEFIEIAGPPGRNLNGLKLVLYNGFDESMYDTIYLSGTLLDQKYGFGTRTFTPNTLIQNNDDNPDGLALVDACGSVLQFLSYGGAFTAIDGPAKDMTSTDIGVSETFTTPAGKSLQLKGDGTCAKDFEWDGPKDASLGCINKGQKKKKDSNKSKSKTRHGVRGL